MKNIDITILKKEEAQKNEALKKGSTPQEEKEDLTSEE